MARSGSLSSAQSVRPGAFCIAVAMIGYYISAVRCGCGQVRESLEHERFYRILNLMWRGVGFG